jgi:hypothetical protein
MVDMRWVERDKIMDDEKEIFQLTVSGGRHEVGSEGQEKDNEKEIFKLTISRWWT